MKTLAKLKPPKLGKVKVSKPKLEVGLGTKSKPMGRSRFFAPPAAPKAPKLNINPPASPLDEESAELEAPPRPDEAEGPKDKAALAALLGAIHPGGPGGPGGPSELPIPSRRGDLPSAGPPHGQQTHINIHLPPIQAKEARPMMRRARKRV